LLAYIDNLWLSFQLICGVFQIHSEGHYHGDINTNNVLLTSWNWLLISDFAPYKPIYLPSEDIGKYQFFFGANSDKSYIAPEKLVSPEDMLTSVSLEEMQAMDIFSMGCVLAEIFLNGHALFDLVKLQSYKKGFYNPKEILNTIEVPEIKELIISMIELIPSKRKTAHEYLNLIIKKIIPKSFIQFLYYFMVIILNPVLSSSDKKIALVFTHLKTIWHNCFQKAPPLILQAINSVVFECIRDIPFNQILPMIIPNGLPHCVSYNDLFETSHVPISPLKSFISITE
jgi:phosphoinositide-3-kinase regulatory subunit 4